MMSEPDLVVRVVRVFGPLDFSNAHAALAGNITQRNFAVSFYADCIRAVGTEDAWGKLNEAVVAKWPIGLERVKRLAWKEVKCDRMTTRQR